MCIEWHKGPERIPLRDALHFWRIRGLLMTRSRRPVALSGFRCPRSRRQIFTFSWIIKFSQATSEQLRMRLVAGQKSEQGRGSVPKLLKQCRKYRSPRTPRRRTVRARVRRSVFFYLVLLSVWLPWAGRPSSSPVCGLSARVLCWRQPAVPLSGVALPKTCR